MARLIVDDHPNRVFKDEFWNESAQRASGYRSIGDFGSEPVKRGELWAFAVVLEDESDDDERELFEDIVHLRAPFTFAEVQMFHGDLCAIGFYPKPTD